MEVEVAEDTLWLVSGGASLLFLGWGLAQRAAISRRTGAGARDWFLVVILAFGALALAVIAQARLGATAPLVQGAALALGGYAFYKAALVHRLLLEAGYGR